VLAGYYEEALEAGEKLNAAPGTIPDTAPARDARAR
jgi:hypothetical protein